MSPVHSVTTRYGSPRRFRMYPASAVSFSSSSADCFRAADLDQLHLVELVLPDHAPGVLP
jgi:hypothetical protein